METAAAREWLKDQRKEAKPSVGQNWSTLNFVSLMWGRTELQCISSEGESRQRATPLLSACTVHTGGSLRCLAFSSFSVQYLPSSEQMCKFMSTFVVSQKETKASVNSTELTWHRCPRRYDACCTRKPMYKHWLLLCVLGPMQTVPLVCLEVCRNYEPQGCDLVQFGMSLLTFRRNRLPLSSGWKSRPNKQLC